MSHGDRVDTFLTHSSVHPVSCIYLPYITPQFNWKMPLWDISKWLTVEIDTGNLKAQTGDCTAAHSSLFMKWNRLHGTPCSGAALIGPFGLTVDHPDPNVATVSSYLTVPYKWGVSTRGTRWSRQPEKEEGGPSESGGCSAERCFISVFLQLAVLQSWQHPV